MLKQRVLTALVLIPLFVALVLLLPPIGFCLLTALVVLWAAWEWSFFMGVKKFPQNLFYPAAVFLVLVLALQFDIHYVLYFSLFFWILAFFLVFYYPAGSEFWGKGILIRAFMGIAVLVPCWLAVNFIFRASPYTLLFLFVVIWGADSAAYFAGKAWGKRKLLPQVSPGKTWEGLAGALFATLMVSLLVLLFLKLPVLKWIEAIILVWITVLFSVLGDLFESMMKRNAGLKDSGHLLPGHGGVLDRIDSLTAAAPIYALGALCFFP